jgi:hypothetical protein
MFGVLLDKEVERIDRDHLDDQTDVDDQLLGLATKHVAANEIPEGVLLPVEEMLVWLDPERILVNWGAGVRRGPEANLVRGQRDAAIEVIFGSVADGHADGHVETPRGKTPLRQPLDLTRPQTQGGQERKALG